MEDVMITNYENFKRFIEDMKDGYGWMTYFFDSEDMPVEIWIRNTEMAAKEGLIEIITADEARCRDLYQISILNDYPEHRNDTVYVICK